VTAWSIGIDFPLISDRYSKDAFYSLGDLIADKKERVRALIWDNIAPSPLALDLFMPRTMWNPLPPLNFINEFNFGDPDDITIVPIGSPVRAILDNRQDIKSLSANHMKITVVQSGNPERLVAFCGGIDIWADRLTNFQHIESQENPYRELTIVPDEIPVLPGISVPVQLPDGLHDTMLKVEGEAAHELNLVLYKRWLDADMHNIPRRTPNKKPFQHYPYSGSNNEGTVMTQVGLTIDPKATPPYGFAANGDKTLLNTLRTAIQKAKQYIYVEDQYFRDPAIIEELGNASARGVVVIIVMDSLNWDEIISAGPALLVDYGIDSAEAKIIEFWHGLIGESPPALPVKPTAKALTASLRSMYPENFVVFSITTPPENIYVHSKLVIVDDIFISCGSANIDTLGTGSDSELPTSCECTLFNIDTVLSQQGARKFVQDSRIRLWAEHLFGHLYMEDVGYKRESLSRLFYEVLKDPILAFKNYWMKGGEGQRVIRLE
jgi:phosphatidylserine/phosphatidylglycerophosphate/cardiolipin synthase-like enzyme